MFKGKRAAGLLTAAIMTLGMGGLAACGDDSDDGDDAELEETDDGADEEMEEGEEETDE